MTFPTFQAPPLPVLAGSSSVAPPAPSPRMAKGGAAVATASPFDATLRKLSGGAASSVKGALVAAQPGLLTPALSGGPVTGMGSRSRSELPKSSVTSATQSTAPIAINSLTSGVDVTAPPPIIAIKAGATKSSEPEHHAAGKLARTSGMSVGPGQQPVQPPLTLAVALPMPVAPVIPVTTANVIHGHADTPSTGATNAAGGLSASSAQTSLLKPDGRGLTQSAPSDHGVLHGSTGAGGALPNLGKTPTLALTSHQNASAPIGAPVVAASVPPAANAAAPSAAAPTPTQATGPNPINAQVSAALVASGPLSADGSHQLTIALAPPAIGPVTVAINRRADGTASIAISAVDPVTLSALRNDHAGITEALAQAGIAAHESGISFQLVSTHAATEIAVAAQTASGGGTNSDAAHHPSQSLSMGQGSVGQQSTGQQGAGQSNDGPPSDRSRLISHLGMQSSVAGVSETAFPSLHSSNLKKFGLDVTA